MKCPNCGHEFEDEITCEVQGCTLPAEFEGWYRVKDSFTGKSTGLVQWRRVCNPHKSLLIGAQNEKAS